MEHDEIKAALDSGNIELLRARWYENVKVCHERMFVVLGKLEPLVFAGQIEEQEDALRIVMAMARDIAGVDMYVAAAGVLYTASLDQVRRDFRILFKNIAILRESAIKDEHATIVGLVNEAHGIACETANVDCFRSLLNGYLESAGLC